MCIIAHIQFRPSSGHDPRATTWARGDLGNQVTRSRGRLPGGSRAGTAFGLYVAFRSANARAGRLSLMRKDVLSRRERRHRAGPRRQEAGAWTVSKRSSGQFFENSIAPRGCGAGSRRSPYVVVRSAGYKERGGSLAVDATGRRVRSCRMPRVRGVGVQPSGCQ